MDRDTPLARIVAPRHAAGSDIIVIKTGRLYVVSTPIGNMGDLSARAHHLSPVVTVGQKGLTESVLREIDRALTAHELISMGVPGRAGST